MEALHEYILMMTFLSLLERDFVTFLKLFEHKTWKLIVINFLKLKRTRKSARRNNPGTSTCYILQKKTNPSLEFVHSPNSTATPCKYGYISGQNFLRHFTKHTSKQNKQTNKTGITRQTNTRFGGQMEGIA